MGKASPAVAFQRLQGVTAAQVYGVAFTANDFISISTTEARPLGGFTKVTNAFIPNFQMYDRGRVLFSVPVITGTSVTATLSLLGLLTDLQGNPDPVLLGRSVLANGQFPPIEFDVLYSKFRVHVTAIGGTTPNITVNAYMQGFHRDFVPL